MLEICIPAREQDELFDEVTGNFIQIPFQKEQVIQLEHSLVSLSKWESKWHKAFFSKKEKTFEETIDYIRCMTLTSNVNPDAYYRIGEKEFKLINAYIEDSMTATVINEGPSKKRSNDVITSELIYYWMLSLNIPFECERWHINRLLTLIRVCNAKNAPDKKMSRKETMSRYAAINAANRKRFKSKG